MTRTAILANPLYLRTLARAQEQGIKVFSETTYYHPEGISRTWAVTGSDPDTIYIVQERRQNGTHYLTCNCAAGSNNEHPLYCKHRAAVVHHLLSR